MLRRSKEKDSAAQVKMITLLFLVWITVFTAAVQAAESAAMQTGEAVICEEDEYIALPSGIYSRVGNGGTTDVFNIYDSHGSRVGSCMGSREPGSYYLMFKKDRLLQESDEEKVDFYNTTGMKQILSLPRDAYACKAQEDVIFTFEYGTSTLRLYDRLGDVMAQKQAQLPEGTVFDRDRTNAQVAEGNGFFYMSVSCEEAAYAAIWFPEEDRWWGAEDSDFPAPFLRGAAGALGEYLIVLAETKYSEDGDSFDIYRLNGECILPRVRPRGWFDSSSYRYVRTDNRFYHVLKRADGDQWIIFDEKLSACGMSDRNWFMYSGTLPVIEGYPYPGLEGRPCDGTLTWEGQEVPYAKTVTGVDVLVGQECISLAVPDGKEPVQVNSLWLLVKDAQERYSVYSCETGELLMDSDTFIQMQNNSLLKWRNYQNEGEENRIFDSDLQPVFHSDRFIQPCGKQNYYIQRGPYIGIADMYGNWLLRVLPEAE